MTKFPLPISWYFLALSADISLPYQLIFSVGSIIFLALFRVSTDSILSIETSSLPQVWKIWATLLENSLLGSGKGIVSLSTIRWSARQMMIFERVMFTKFKFFFLQECLVFCHLLPRQHWSLIIGQPIEMTVLLHCVENFQGATCKLRMGCIGLLNNTIISEHSVPGVASLRRCMASSGTPAQSSPLLLLARMVAVACTHTHNNNLLPRSDLYRLLCPSDR